MENVHAERSAGWSVLCYVGVLVIATLLNNGMPSMDVRPATAALLIDAHRFGLLLGAWLTFPAAAFFLWFLVGLRSYLSHAQGRQEGLPTLAMIAGVVMVAGSLLAAAIESAALYAAPDMFAHNGLVGAYDVFVFTQGGLGYAAVSIFLFAAAHSMRRHESAPGWLAALGYVASFGAAIATLSIFFTTTYSFMAPGQLGPGVFGAVPAAIWLVCTGVVLIQSRRGAASASTSAAS
ncbi:MAG: hypothetical protein JO190_11375 [Candidatus Eremiobacteraeota bacterium]|nr:hypothetical protein [Candidatus Eremiobacteraeota bacterium]MBV8498324.1 hypothetical protein [Candidatus Eremiobacteraeota bacterium]